MIANPCILGDKDCEILSLIEIIDPGATLGGVPYKRLNCIQSNPPILQMSGLLNVVVLGVKCNLEKVYLGLTNELRYLGGPKIYGFTFAIRVIDYT